MKKIIIVKSSNKDWDEDLNEDFMVDKDGAVKYAEKWWNSLCINDKENSYIEVREYLDDEYSCYNIIKTFGF